MMRSNVTVDRPTNRNTVEQIQIRLNVVYKKNIMRKLLTDEVHWMTSRQLSPSPATKRNHSPASLSLHNSCSKDSSFFVVESSDCRFVLAPLAVVFCVVVVDVDVQRNKEFPFIFSISIDEYSMLMAE